MSLLYGISFPNFNVQDFYVQDFSGFFAIIIYERIYFMQIQLSEHFTYRKLLRFVLPSIIMMIFTSIYSVVDGLFVSNFVGKTALAAINLTLPIIMGLSALGFMIGTGGSAIVARMLGEKKKIRLMRIFPCSFMQRCLEESFFPFLVRF